MEPVPLHKRIELHGGWGLACNQPFPKGQAWTDQWEEVSCEECLHAWCQAKPLPRDVATTLLRALVWCGNHVTNEQREKAWAWVERARGPVEEMGQ